MADVIEVSVPALDKSFSLLQQVRQGADPQQVKISPGPFHLMKLCEFTPAEGFPHKPKKWLVAAVCCGSPLGCKFQMLVWKLQELLL